MEPGWLQWAKELQSIAQIGLAYPSGDHFDRERYERIREIAAEMMSSGGGMDKSSLLGLFERQGDLLAACRLHERLVAEGDPVQAPRHAWLLGRQEPTLVDVVKAVIDSMGDAYPELRTREQHLLKTTRVQRRKLGK